jgi:EmrB/QacA subfamily drug resistance transporter
VALEPLVSLWQVSPHPQKPMASMIKQPCDEAAIRSATAVAPCTKSAEPWILAATIVGSSLAFIDGTVVNVALPALQADLNATVVDAQWVVESFALFLAALVLVGGSLGDRFGRRRVYAIGVGLFAAASAWCGIAPGVGQLIVARAVQGIGAALLVPGSLAIIGASFSESTRGRAIGTWSGFTSITAAVGPIIGGWLIERASWRAAFFINLPLAAIVLALVFWRVPESRDNRHQGVDWRGAVLATSGLGTLVFGLIESSSLGFTHRAVIGSIAGGILLLAAFLIVEARIADPMLPVSLFRSRNFSGANLLTLLLYAALGGSLFFVPLNLIQVQRYSATAAGAALLPFILTIFVLSRWSGGLVDRYGAKLPLTIGPVIAAAGFALFTAPRVSHNYWTSFFPAVVVLGVGMAISVAPLTTTVMNSVKSSQAGVASGISNAVSRTAGLLAVAMFGIVMLHSFNQNLDQRLAAIDLSPETRLSIDQQRVRLAGIEPPATLTGETRISVDHAIGDSFVSAFRVVMWVSAGLGLLSGLSAWLLIEGKAIPAKAQSDNRN